MDIGHILEERLSKRRYSCAHCGYTWMEFVGLIIEKGQESDDVHFRIGDVPCECQTCGCDDVYEIGVSEKAQSSEASFEGIKRVTGPRSSEEERRET